MMKRAYLDPSQPDYNRLSAIRTTASMPRGWWAIMTYVLASFPVMFTLLLTGQLSMGWFYLIAGTIWTSTGFGQFIRAFFHWKYKKLYPEFFVEE